MNGHVLYEYVVNATISFCSKGVLKNVCKQTFVKKFMGGIN